MRPWLVHALDHATRVLQQNEEAEGYLRGRAVSTELMSELSLGVWEPPDEPSPSTDFNKKYGSKGEYLQGRITIPLLSPRGHVVGFEARTWQSAKNITDFRLPETKWNPVFIGMTPETVHKIWKGCGIWICEGVFDLSALSRVVPEQDVVLATLRAKLSEQHLTFLGRFSHPHKNTVYIVYDQDETGRKQVRGWVDERGRKRLGALDLLERVYGDKRSVIEVRYSGSNKDPGEVWDKGGVAALKRVFSPYLGGSRGL